MQIKLPAFLFLAAAACGGSKPATTPVKPAQPDQTAIAANAAAAQAEVAEQKAKEPPPGPALVATISEGIATPESMLYDVANDRYLISNVNGAPLTVDNNGYIATLAADGTTVEKWIVGGANKVTLNAPKGMAIAGGVLYVTDITTVRKFDLKTGAAKGEIKIAGATFLNDLAVGANDVLYVSDSGLKAGKKDFEPTGSDAVYKIDTKAKTAKAVKVAKDKSLDKPNGLSISATNQVWVSPFSSNNIYMLDDAGKKGTVVQLHGGGLDGIVDTGKHIIVSSWEKSTIYAAVSGSEPLTFAPLIENVSSPADIGYDAKRNRLLLPRMMDNKVEIYQLPAAK